MGRAEKATGRGGACTCNRKRKKGAEELRKRAIDGESLDDLLPEAFANCREGARRTLGLRAFDTQLMSAIFLHQGNISEQKTGECKTLTATLAAYLNALTGKGVHVVTVNDYLASRDSEWMGQVYKFLGLTVGCIVHGLNDEERREQYAAEAEALLAWMASRREAFGNRREGAEGSSLSSCVCVVYICCGYVDGCCCRPLPAPHHTC